jgi:AraC family transcriptional regulator, glycine betaine-responsive activator
LTQDEVFLTICELMLETRPDPLEVTLLVLPDASLMSLAATLDPMRAANRLAGQQCYRYRVVSPDGRDPNTSSGLTIRVDGAFDPNLRCDLLIVVAAFRIFEHASPGLLRALRKAARNAAHVGGIEAGSWVLALAGLLDGHSATTHWEDLEDFAARFPRVNVKADRWVIDGRYFTTGGAAPALDFLLSVIRERQGHTLSLDVASLYVYDGLAGAWETQPTVSLGRLTSQEPRLTEAIRIMENHVDAPLSIADIAHVAAVSTKTLETAFRRGTGQSPAQFYLGLRLNMARRLVVDTNLAMADVAVRSGFSSVSTLSRAFKRRFGASPKHIRCAMR